MLPEINRFRHDYRVGQYEAFDEIGSLACHQQGHAPAHGVPAQDHALWRFFLQPFDHIVAVAFPGFHAAGFGLQCGTTMPPHVERRHTLAKPEGRQQ